MANTKQGIYYQDDYSLVADVPSDMKKMAESVDTELETDRGRLSKNETDITEIKAKNTAQDTNIATLTQRLTEKENQIAELEDKVSDLNNNQIHGQASGEYVHLSDSAKMNCEIAVLGNSKQETETDIMDNTWEQGDIDSASGKTGTSSNAVRVKNYIHVISNVEYRISRTIATSYMSFRFYDKDYNYLGTQAVDGMISTDLTNQTKNMQKDVYNQTMTILNTDVAYMKIVDFSNSLNIVYKIKTDAINLNYPSEIECVSSANVKVCNKNLFPILQSQSIERKGITFSYNADKQEFNAKGTTTDTSFYTTLTFDELSYLNKDKKYMFSIDKNTPNNCAMQITKVNKIANATIPSSGNNAILNNFEKGKPNGIMFFSSNIEVGTNIDFTFKVQIEENPTATDYIPHEEQNYPVDMQEPFKGMQINTNVDFYNYVDSEGNKYIRDCFVEKDGKLYEAHYIKRVVADGVNYKAIYVFPNGKFILVDCNGKEVNDALKIKNSVFEGIIACNKLKNIDRNSIETNKGIAIASIGNIHIKLDDATEETSTWTIDTVNAFLQENPLTIDYALAEPYYIECTEAQTQQLQALQKAKTYKNITNITTDTIAVLDVDYKKDLETIINNMQAQILAE